MHSCRWKNWLSLFFLLQLTLLSVLHANEEIEFNRISIEEGLPHISVNQILQDHLGYLWFATDGGLAKYDGINFTVYEHVPEDTLSLQTASVLCLFNDKQNHLWVGTTSGLSLFNRKQNTFINFTSNSANPNCLSTGAVTSIIEDSRGNLWIGTNSGGVNIIGSEILANFNKLQQNPNLLIFQHLFQETSEEYPGKNVINNIYEDHLSQIWISTSYGLYKLDLVLFDKFPTINEDLFEQIQLNHNIDNSLNTTEVLVCYEDRSGSYWIGTWEGLIRMDFYNDKAKAPVYTHYKHKKNDPSSISDDFILSIFEQANDSLWIGTSDGLNSLNRKNGAFTHYPYIPSDPKQLSDGTILSISEDMAGHLWLGTADGGANQLVQKKEFRNYIFDSKKSDAIVGSIAYTFYEPEPNVLWIGTNRGLSIFDIKKDLFLEPSSQYGLLENFNNRITAIHKDNEGILWLGGDSELFRFGPKKPNSLTLDQKLYVHNPTIFGNLNDCNIMSILRTEGDYVLVGTGCGLYILKSNISQVISDTYSLQNALVLGKEMIYSMLKSRDGTIWVGTNEGLKELEESLNNEQAYKYVRYNIALDDTGSIEKEIVYALHESIDGTLWIGTQNGLKRIARNSNTGQPKILDSYSKTEGLDGNFIYSILEDEKGILWLNTNKGISCFNTETLIIRNFDIGDGVQKGGGSGSNSTFKMSNGEMIFGGLNGFTIFHPNSISIDTIQSSIVITSLKRNGMEVNTEPTLFANSKTEFSNKDIITFEFSLLNYNDPKKNQYAYKLEGYDADWIYCGARNFANYSVTKPGVYTFTVKAANSDGIWSSRSTSYKIIITIPIWKKWWFLSCIVLTFLIGIILLYRYKVKLKTIQGLSALKSQNLLKSLINKYSHEVMTQREIEVLAKLCEGASYKVIAKDLYISLHTVQSHIKNIYRKLDVNSKAEAVAKALSDKLIT
jgi:ligand-binding sensor domain-containing protein/DNA-binding CsgD family transcriptional regulator